jgi:hypothetical protein
MRNIIIALLTVVLVIMTACSEQTQTPAMQKPIGGDKDAHGCLIAAGYSWCPSTEKCQRMWEEYCPEFADQYRGANITSFAECVAAGNPVMESYPRRCNAQGQTFVEDFTEAMAYQIANASDCVKEGPLRDSEVHNPETGTWWIDMDVVKEGCQPACVVYEENRTAEINWRCTGLVSPSCAAPTGESMTLTEAQVIADEVCNLQGRITEETLCNDGTGTWWLGFTPSSPKEGCNPACVVDVKAKTAEINWRCTGLITE